MACSNTCSKKLLSTGCRGPIGRLVPTHNLTRPPKVRAGTVGSLMRLPRRLGGAGEAFRSTGDPLRLPRGGSRTA